MTRAVLFDVDGVLINGYHSNPARVRAWDKTMLADIGVDPDRLRKEFTFETFVKKVIVGQMSFVEALDKHLPALGYKGSSMAFAHYWLHMDSELNQETVAIARTLKTCGDCRLYIATNQEHMRAMWLWGKLGLSEIFDDMFYSARLGLRKPDPRYFEYIARAIGPQAEPPLFFDDTPAVVAAASKAGWEAVLFDTVDDCRNHPWIAERLSRKQ